ncbi:MAG: class I SAM-dependent methyltransferase [Candidatus Paceibacterota bacterium]|jgi:hypothetical protein
MEMNERNFIQAFNDRTSGDLPDEDADTGNPEQRKYPEKELNIGEVYFDKGLDGVMDKEEFSAEVQKINSEIEKYLGENENTSAYDFRVYSDRKEYEEYLKAGFPDKFEKGVIEDDMYCIYDEKSDKYHIGKFMTLKSDPDDPKVRKYLEENEITFEEFEIRSRKNYKYSIYPTIAHELTHAHSFFNKVDYREPGNKWAQEMACVFIDQEMWEKYTKDFFDYRKMVEDKAREQVRDKDPYDEIVKDFKEGDFAVEEWERLVCRFLENRFGKEKLKEFWSVLSERKREADLEKCFGEVFGERLKDVMKLFREEVGPEPEPDLDNAKEEAHLAPMIEELKSGYKLKYRYPDGEEIEVQKEGYDPGGFVHIKRRTPDGKIKENGFDRTNRDARWFFGTRNPEQLREFVKDKNLGQTLDVGTGAGKFMDELREAGTDARGLDIWLDHKQIDSGNFILASAHRTGLPDNSVDTIFINTFMHYGMENEFRKEILEELARILRPNGRILMSIVKGDQRRYYNSILKDLKLKINASSEFSKKASKGKLEYIELRKVSD